MKGSRRKTLDRALIGIVLMECAIGGALAIRQWRRPSPPLPRVVLGEATAARDITAHAATCETASDWSQLGEEFLAYGYLSEAEACFARAMEIEPFVGEHAFDRAFALERLGRLDEANALYREAIALGLTTPDDCSYFIGRNQLRLGDIHGARATFGQATDLVAARFELAKLAAAENAADNAAGNAGDESALQRRAIGPAVLRYQLAMLSGDTVTPEGFDAARYANEPLATPFNVQYERLTKVFARLGATRRWQAAREAFADGDINKARQLLQEVDASEWSPMAADLEAEIDTADGQGERAILTRKRIIARDGPSMLALGRLGDAYEALGRRDEAVAAWERAAALGAGPQIQDIHERLARDAQRRGDEAAAKQHSSLVHYHAGVALFWSERWQSAEGEFREATSLDRQLADAWCYLGLTLVRRGHTDDARIALESCLKIKPHHGRAADALKRCNTK